MTHGGSSNPSGTNLSGVDPSGTSDLARPATTPPQSRTDWVTARLRADILSGSIPPGERLRSKVLEERYAISATPVREALQRLAAEGLVQVAPQLGARVSPLDPVEAENLYELRIMLEPMAVRRSLARAGEDRWAQVDAAYLRMREADGAGMGEEFFARHNAFHRLLRADCDSTWLLRVVDVLVTNCERYRRLRRDDVDRVHHEHDAIRRACAARDIETAVALTTDHLTVTLAAVRAAITGDGQ